MKIEQAAMLLEIARNAMLGVEGVYSVRTSIQTDELVVHVIKEVFDTIPGEVVIEYGPDDVISNFGLSKRNNGIKFNALLEPKAFYELYPNYGKE